MALDTEQQAAVRRLAKSELSADQTTSLSDAIAVVDAVKKSADYVSLIASRRTPDDADSRTVKRTLRQVRRDLLTARKSLIECALAITEDHLLANRVGAKEIADDLAWLEVSLGDPDAEHDVVPD